MSEATWQEKGLAKKYEPASLTIENLKTLRLLHQLLMIVSAAILAFALRADHSKDYRAALDELTALKETQFETWPTFIRTRYKNDEDQNDRFVRDIIRRSGVPLQGTPELNEPVFADRLPLKDGSTLLQLDAFFAGNQTIAILKLKADRARAAEELKQKVATRHAHSACCSGVIKENQRVAPPAA